MESSRKIIKQCILLIALISLHKNFIWAQLGEHQFLAQNIPSPNAATFIKYGDIPVDLYTGTPSINIPLLTVINGGIEVPVTLDYQGSGILINQQPGWAGLGWNLFAGGQITRKTNWFIDEYHNANTAATDRDYGYFFLGKVLDKNVWNTQSFIQDRLMCNPVDSFGDLEPDEFQFHFGAYSGSFYRSEKGAWKVKSKQHLSLIIEHEIVFNNTYKLYKLFGPSSDEEYETPPSQYNENIASLFTKFIITTPDGYKYTFGGDPSAIEFSRSSLNNNDYIIPPLDYRSNHITANTWYLTKITTPKGETVNFGYKRGRVVFKAQEIIQNIGTFFSRSISISSINPTYLSYIETPFQKVEFITSEEVGLGPKIPTGTGTTLPSPSSTELKRMVCQYWKDISYALSVPQIDQLPNWNRQLDSIKIFDKNQQAYINGYKFYHKADVTKRRSLDSLKLLSFVDNIGDVKYKFEYNSGGLSNLPGYETLARDHWGYYNGQDNNQGEYTPSRVASNYATTEIIQKIIYPTGGETEFIFEPGIYAKFEYVNINDINNPVSLADISEDEVNASHKAGVRIKKIINKANYNSPPVTKEYIYVSNYAGGGSVSSGILGSYPRYRDVIHITNSGTGPCSNPNGVINYRDDNSEWINQSKGGIVNYSEVTEKNDDGSYTVSKYSNYDNFPDKIHDIFVNGIDDGIAHITWQNNYRISSMDLDRGLLLSQNFYNSSGVKVKRLEYQYDFDPNRTNNYIKAIAHIPFHLGVYESCMSWGESQRGVAYRIYTYTNSLIKVTETSYESGGAVSETHEYGYDEYGNVTTESSYNSLGQKQIVTTRYNSNPDYLNTALDANAAGVKKLFINYKIKNYPVEQTVQIDPTPGPPIAFDTKYTGGVLYLYDPNKPVVSKIYKLELAEPFAAYNGPTPAFSLSKINTSGNLVFDSRYKLQESISSFTTTLKPLTVAGIKRNEAYTWNHKTRFISSVTTNATNDQVAYCNFEETYSSGDDENKGNWSFSHSPVINLTAPMGEKCFRLKSEFGTGVVTFLQTKYALTSGKNYLFSFWLTDPVSSNNYPNIYNGTTLLPSYAPKKSANGWSYYEIAVTGTGQKLKISLPVPATPISVIKEIDEVRLYPANAAMKSYDYDPATGNVKHMCDEQNNIQHFEYDGLGRLKTIKDTNGKILKAFTYQYQGQ